MGVVPLFPRLCETSPFPILKVSSSCSSSSSSSRAQPRSEGREQLRVALQWQKCAGAGPRRPAPNKAALVCRSVSSLFHRCRDVGQRGTEKFQRFFTCKRIFPLRVSRLNKTPVSKGPCTPPTRRRSERREPGGRRGGGGRGCPNRRLFWKKLRAGPPPPARRPFQIWRKGLLADLGNEMGWI